MAFWVPSGGLLSAFWGASGGLVMAFLGWLLEAFWEASGVLLKDLQGGFCGAFWLSSEVRLGAFCWPFGILPVAFLGLLILSQVLLEAFCGLLNLRLS